MKAQIQLWPFLLLTVLSLVAVAEHGLANPPTIKRLVIPERAPDLLVCAEYTSTSAPRQPNRSCFEAAKVREWILANAPENQCH